MLNYNQYKFLEMDENYMRICLELANEALMDQEVPVGCIFVDTSCSNIVAKSRNTVNVTHNPTRHAEMNCIDIALEYCRTKNIDYKSYFKSLTVYVTVEPCIMCAAALHILNVQKVVYGCANDRFGGKTVLDVSIYHENSYEVSENVIADEAMVLLKQFYKGENPNAPESKVKKKKIC